MRNIGMDFLKIEIQIICTYYLQEDTNVFNK